MASLVEHAIVLTLAYSDQFAWPLTEVEVWQRLVVTEPRYVRSDISKGLARLHARGLIAEYQSWYALASRKSELPQLVARRQESERLTQEKLAEAEHVLTFVRCLPWVQAVAITGSVAVGNTRVDDDLDFLIVTAPHRLWLTRLLVTGFAWAKGKRRSWKHEEKNSWCFNLWLDERNLAVAPQARSVYLAYEVCQARWLWQRWPVREQFLQTNAWVARVLPNYYQALVAYPQPASKTPGWLRLICTLGTPLWSLLDWLAYHLQLWYMQPHRTRERVGRGFAFFHPRDTRAVLYQGWQRSLENLLQRV